MTKVTKKISIARNIKNFFARVYVGLVYICTGKFEEVQKAQPKVSFTNEKKWYQGDINTQNTYKNAR